MQSSDEDSDDMPVALAQKSRKPSGRTHTTGRDRTDLSRAKTLNSHTPSNYQPNLARRYTEHARGRTPVTDKLEHNQSDSDNSGLVRGRSTTRASKTHATEKSGKSVPHDIRSVQSDLHKLQLAAVQKIPSRIYINDSSRYVGMQLTSLLTTAMIIESLREKGVIDHEQSWTLFELANKVGVERPLRDWEIVTDVLSTWDQDEKNALLVKRYSYKSTLTPSSVLQQGDFIPPSGQLHFQYKKGKWHKRFFAVKENAIYCARDSKKLGDTPLIPLSNVDVYTLTLPMKKAPTDFGFVLKAQEKARIFENPEDFVFNFCAENMEQMRQWVLGLRQVKNLASYSSHPERVLSPLKPVELPPLPKSVIQKVLSPTTSTPPLLDQQSLLNTDSEHKSSSTTDDIPPSQAKVHRSATLLDRQSTMNRSDEQGKASVRRYKSTRETSSSTRHNDLTPESRMEQEAKLRVSEMPQPKLVPIPRASKSTGTKRSGTISKGYDHSAEVSPVVRSEDKYTSDKGTLLATDERCAPSTQDDNIALIKLEDDFQFSQGSLLQQVGNPSITTRGRSKSVSRDPRMARSQSRSRHAAGHDAKDQPSSASRSKSLRRKPTLRDKDFEAEAQPPLPVTAGEDGPLLQLDVTPEASHTQALRNRQVKPLITF